MSQRLVQPRFGHWTLPSLLDPVADWHLLEAGTHLCWHPRLHVEAPVTLQRLLKISCLPVAETVQFHIAFMYKAPYSFLFRFLIIVDLLAFGDNLCLHQKRKCTKSLL